MRVINRTPFQLAPLMGRVHYPSHTATLVVKAGFRLVNGEKCQTLEDQPPFGGEVMSKGKPPECLYNADLEYFKPRADLTLTGSCHTPGGQPATTCPVTFGVGDWSKTIAAIGNRHWEKSLLRSRMTDPEPFTKVPLTWANAFGGPNFAANPAGKGHKDVLLPNLEVPDDLITSAGSKPRPAGFGPILRTWKSRAKKLGTYDKKWLKERWPAFPEDLDWTYFNAAPADQQLGGYLVGDEQILLQNMHPQHATLKSTLPGIRVRVLLREGLEGAEVTVREVPMNLDTLHVDADKNEVYLLWRGVANVGDGDWDECREILLVSEMLTDEPQTIEQLTPLFQEDGDEAEAVEGEPPPETPEERLATMDKLFAKAEAQAAAVESQASALAMKQLPKGQALKPMAGEINDFKHAEAAVKKAMAMHPPTAAKLPPGVSPSHFNPMSDPDVKELLNLGKAMKPPKAGEAKKIAALIRSGESRGADFSKAQLKGQQLAGSDLRETNLEGADLSGADLKGADLSDALLSRANLVGADLSGANLSGADLTGADLSGAKFSKATMKFAVLQGCMAPGAEFNEAAMADAECGALLGDGSMFVGADLTNAVFAAASLKDADFTAAKLTGAGFEGVQASGAKFDGAELTGFRGAEGDFGKATFINAKAAESNWTKGKLLEADFGESDLTRALFPEADLTGARLYAANLAGGMLRRANLKDVKAGNANFFQATLQKVDFSGASLVASNFFEADFFEAVTEGADFTGANLKMTTLAN